MPTNSQLIANAYVNLTDAALIYRDNWISDESLLRLINSHCPDLKGAFKFNRGALNKALKAHAGPIDESNKSNVSSRISKPHAHMTKRKGM